MTNNLTPELFNQLMAAEAERRRRDEEKRAYDQRIETTIKILSALYDKAAAYTNLIIVAGYAGMFALWNIVKPYLGRKTMLSTALLFSFSLLVFVLWEVSLMFYNSKNLSMFNKALQVPQGEFEAAIQEAYKTETTRSVRFRRYWPPVLFGTICPALIGGLILFWSFIRQLFFAT